MTCELPGPIWENSNQAGLQSAQENTAQSTYDLSWGQAETSSIPANPTSEVYYNIYWGTDIFTLFDTPRAFSTELSASLPKSLFSDDGYLFGVRAAQLGATANFDSSNLPAEIDTNIWLYPSTTTTRFFYENDGYMPVNSVSGFPQQDGYIKIGEEVIFYSDALDGYDGYGAFIVSSRDPFGCNDGYRYNAGTSVELFRGFEEGNGVNFGPTELCVPPQPTWVEGSRPGLESAGDLGIGQVVELHWGPAAAPTGRELYYNVYWATRLQDLWEAPKGLTQSETILVPGLSPGDGYYFAVRATYYPEEIDLSDFEQLTGSLSGYPQNTTTSSAYSSSEISSLFVNSTTGWPAAGYLVIGSEILQYTSKTSSSFTISRRDVFDFGQQAAHASGSTVKFWAGIEDENYQYYNATPSWDKGEVSPILPVVTDPPQYMQGEDGYRTQPVDNLTEDHSNYEEDNEDFRPYPFCGYRATNFVALYTRNVCNTYFGGRQDGFGGVDMNEVNLQRQEMLLGITGEPMTLLRRKWTGRQCPKLSHRHEHPHARCGTCFGTTFAGGYDRYSHGRNIRPGVDNPNGLIMVRIPPYKNDLDRSPERGLTQVDELPAWTIAIPQLRDSDILIRYIFEPTTLEIIEEEFRYQILNVTRNRTVIGNDGQQQFALRKLDKTDPIYTFDVPII